MGIAGSSWDTADCDTDGAHPGILGTASMHIRVNYLSSLLHPLCIYGIMETLAWVCSETSSALSSSFCRQWGRVTV